MSRLCRNLASDIRWRFPAGPLALVWEMGCRRQLQWLHGSAGPLDAAEEHVGTFFRELHGKLRDLAASLLELSTFAMDVSHLTVQLSPGRGNGLFLGTALDSQLHVLQEIPLFALYQPGSPFCCFCNGESEDMLCDCCSQRLPDLLEPAALAASLSSIASACTTRNLRPFLAATVCFFTARQLRGRRVFASRLRCGCVSAVVRSRTSLRSGEAFPRGQSNRVDQPATVSFLGGFAAPGLCLEVSMCVCIGGSCY
jgi:hypothetical protein